MTKLPKTVLTIVCILLGGIIFFVIILIELGFTQDNYNIEFSTWEYKISMGIIAIVSFILGIFFISLQKAWTLENFADRIQNAITANHLFFLIKQKKAKMGWQDDVEITIKKGK